MNKNSLLLLLLFLSLNGMAQIKTAPAEEKTSSIASFTSGMKAMPGFIPLYWDAKRGKVWLEINQFDTELLYYASLAAGVGSNDIGLDRGRIGPSHVVKFQRSGNKVLLTEVNYGYRALTDNAMEKRAVEESFAQSV
jgi:hypothetical protein